MEPGEFFKSAESGMKVHYRKYAPPSASTHTVVFFHGLNDHCNKLQYTTLMKTLALKLNAHVYAADMIGHGQSEASAPKLIRSWKQLVDDATQFLYHVIPQDTMATFSFVSHSTGGAVSLHLLASMTQETLARCRGSYTMAPLILTSPVPAPMLLVLTILATFCPHSAPKARKTDKEPWLVFPSPGVCATYLLRLLTPVSSSNSSSSPAQAFSRMKQ